jgi:fimbrial chaperone protein
LALLTANVRFAAAADTFAVSPVRISIPSGDRSEAVTVTNGSDGPVRFQVTGFAWAQRPDGATELTPSEDLIIFPTLATVAAHQSQVIRIGVVGASSDTERTFRIFLRQLPEPNTAQNPARASITIRTRYSIPVFLEPPRPASHLRIL